MSAVKKVVFINGTMGVGKTATSRELRELLPRNVFLDGDWCWEMRPFVVTEETTAMVRGNITHLLNSFLACSEFEYVIFCWVMHTQEILDSLLDALDLDGHAVYRFTLTSNETSLADRLNRDVEAGLRDADIVSRSIERLRLYDAFDTMKIDVSAITARQAAERIAANMGCG
jgi:AAA domain